MLAVSIPTHVERVPVHPTLRPVVVALPTIETKIAGIGLTAVAGSVAPLALVVDDNPMVLMDASDILEDAGFRVHAVGEGHAALATLERHGDEIELLFSDVEMPGMNGFELCWIVNHRWPDVEIVICSGRISPIPSDMPAKATFIAKPFNAQTIKIHLAQKLPDEKKPEPLKRLA